MQRKLAATYFIGYEVVGVATQSGGWTIDFGHGSIGYHEGKVAVPLYVKGATLRNVTYADGKMALIFSTGVVSLGSESYTVTHPSCGTIWPEVDQEIPDALPRDPSPLRVVDGPEQMVGE